MCIIMKDGSYILMGRLKPHPPRGWELEANMYSSSFSKHLNVPGLMQKKAELGSLLVTLKSKR